jgi:hypothetical protein
MHLAGSLLILFVLISCGVPGGARRSTPAKPILDPLSSTPDFLVKGIKTCREERRDYLYEIAIFKGKEDQFESRDFRHLLDGNSLRDPRGRSIHSVTYDSKYNFIINSLNGESRMALTNYEPGKTLEICPGVLRFESNTFEAAGLSTAFYIDRMYQRVGRVLTTRIPPVSLEVGSRIINERLNVREGKLHLTPAYSVDNAMYLPDSHKIIFVPHGFEIRKYNFNSNFWQVPIIPSHEYAHHIFNLIGPETKANQGIVSNCFGEKIEKSSLVEIDASGDRRVTVESVRNALNEGFADLLAYYSLDRDERSTIYVPLLSFNRDVESPNFNVGEPKNFQHKALAKFFSPKSPPRTNLEIDYQDIHIIGAIFAHRVYKLLESSVIKEEAKVEFILDWAKDLRRLSSSLSPQNYMNESMILLAEKYFEYFGPSHSSKHCQKVRELYPFSDRDFPSCR